jgi:hypothetical protein
MGGIEQRLAPRLRLAVNLGQRGGLAGGDSLSFARKALALGLHGGAGGLGIVQQAAGGGLPLGHDARQRPQQKAPQQPDEHHKVDRLQRQCPPVYAHGRARLNG